MIEISKQKVENLATKASVGFYESAPVKRVGQTLQAFIATLEAGQAQVKRRWWDYGIPQLQREWFKYLDRLGGRVESPKKPFAPYPYKGE